MDYRRLSKYPFHKDAQEWIRQQGVSLTEVLTNDAYERVKAEGLNRVMQCMEEAGLGDMSATREDDLLRKVLSYPIARMLVSAVGDILLIRRYALREADAAHEHMVREDTGFLQELGADELDMPGELVDGGELKVHFTDYLKNASAIRDRAWKLYNQDLRDGWVTLPRERYVRLLQEALRNRIESELPLEVNEQILEALDEEIKTLVEGVDRLRASIQKESYGEFSMEYLAPCMRELLGKVQSGVNIPHVARFALTAFLYHVGLDADDIIDLFRVSPDFKEDIASYQVRHIGGDISGTRYTPPSCSTMVTYGICTRDKACEGMGHPLTFYYRRQKQAERESGKTPPTPEVKAEEEGPEEVDAGGG